MPRMGAERGQKPIGARLRGRACSLLALPGKGRPRTAEKLGAGGAER